MLANFSRDTAPEMEELQLEIYRRMGAARRLRQALDLTRTSRALLAAGVRARHPHYSDDEVRLAVIRLLLPEDLFLEAYPHAKEIRP